jgi:NADH-ubiquinone oxidoreductase chain 6
MFNLYYIQDFIDNGYKDASLDLLILVGLIFGVLTIISKNPIISVLFLIGLFSVISIYLIFVNLTFIGISYLLVYVGAVSILFLFILMLINIRISELTSKSNNYIPLAILCVMFFIPIFGENLPINKKIISSNLFNEKLINNEISNDLYNNDRIFMVISNS